MTLTEILQVPDEKRDPQWEREFFDAILLSKVNMLGPQAQQGPDGWPYLLAETSEAATEPVVKVLNWLAMRGIGLVINPQKDYPDFVFNYGMIWNFRETGLFVQTTDEVTVGTVELKAGTGLLSGPPTAKFLPDYVRVILKEFFRDQGLLAVKILVLSQDRKHYDLAFSLESLGNPEQKEHQGLAEAISWFLPPHYSLLLVSEEGLPDFIPL